MEDDQEIKLIEERKLAEMRKKMKAVPQPKAPKPEKTPRQALAEMLYDRADEVLDAAYSFYPEQTGRIVEELADMIRNGRLTEKISGGELFAVFRQLGLRFSLKTSIRVQDRGKLVELSEKLKRKEGE